MFKAYKIRRPFSRKIELGTDSLITKDGRAAYFAQFGSLMGKSALATAFGAVGKAYGSEAEEASHWAKVVRDKGFGTKLRRLTEQADFRKYLLACLRDYFQASGPITATQAKALLEVAQATDMDCKTIFEDHSQAALPSAPLSFDYTDKRPQGLKIAIYMRAFYYGPQSRPHDLRHRFASAFDGGGVTAVLVDPDAPEIAYETCDMAIIDDTHVFRKDPVEKRAFLEQVRKTSGKMIMLEPDPWSHGLEDRVASNKDLYDFIWHMAPSLMTDGDEDFCGLPAVLIPFPVGAPAIFQRHMIAGPEKNLTPLKFCGGVEPYNFYRYFWVLAGTAMDGAAQYQVTHHDADGLSVMDSLDEYVARLAGSYGCLSFLMRGDGRVMVVGRSSDAFALGQLLVQEQCPDMHAYFTPGQDYLEFGNVDQLQDICRQMAGGERFDEVRRAGMARFQAKYSDDAVLRHLATYL